MTDPRGDKLDAFDRWHIARVERARAQRGVVASAATLAEYGAKPFLARSEVVSIIQGFTPDLYPSNDSCAVLDDYHCEIERLKADEAAGRLTLPCRPDELVTWASAAGVELPGEFIAAVAATGRPVPSAGIEVPRESPDAVAAKHRDDDATTEVAKERKNAREKIDRALSEFFDAVESRTRAAGLSFDRQRMRGVKREWAALARRFDRSLTDRADATFADDFDRLGLRWPLGARPGTLDTFLVAIGIPSGGLGDVALFHFHPSSHSWPTQQ